MGVIGDLEGILDVGFVWDLDRLLIMGSIWSAESIKDVKDCALEGDCGHSVDLLFKPGMTYLGGPGNGCSIPDIDLRTEAVGCDDGAVGEVGSSYTSLC